MKHEERDQMRENDWRRKVERQKLMAERDAGKRKREKRDGGKVKLKRRERKRREKTPQEKKNCLHFFLCNDGNRKQEEKRGS